MSSNLYRQVIDRLEAHGRDYFTAQELADALDLTRGAIYKWHRSGELRGVRMGARDLRFGKRDAIEHFVRMQEAEPLLRREEAAEADADGGDGR